MKNIQNLTIKLFAFTYGFLPSILFSCEAFASEDRNSAAYIFSQFKPFLFFFAIFLLFMFYKAFFFHRKINKIKTTLKNLAQKDPKWEEETLKKEITRLFLKIEKARSEADYDTLKNNLTKEFYYIWVPKLKKLKRNPAPSKEVYKITIASIENYIDDRNDEFVADIKASPRTKTKRHDPIDVMEFWSFCWDGDAWKVSKIAQMKEGFDEYSNSIVDENAENDFVK